ncbi:copia protein [Tanacetum coccineum]
MAPPSTLNTSPPLSLIISLGISPSKVLLTPKSTPPPLTSPLPALTQPSKHSSPLAINLDPVDLLFSTPPSSPQTLFDSLEDLPPKSTNPPPPRPSFDSIEYLANEPPPLPAIELSLPPFPPQPPTFPPNPPSNFSPLPPLGPNIPFPLLTHEIFCENCQHASSTEGIFSALASNFPFVVYDNYKPTIKDKDGKDVITTYEKFDENHKKMISKNDEAKIVLYNALTKKEYERIFIFNTIITSLKALDESFSSRNHVRKFLRDLPTKWHLKVTAIEESKDLSTVTLDELIGSLKVYEMAVRDFKKFFRKRGKFVRQPYDDKKNFRKVKEDKRRRMIEDVSTVEIQITSLVIVPNTPSMIKKHSLSGVGVIVKMIPRRKKYVSWHLTTMRKFDPKSTEGIFLGYSPNTKAYIILNKETMKIEESLNVKFDESPPPMSPPLEDDDVLECDIIENQEKDLKIKKNEPLNKEIINIKESKDHPLDTIIARLESIRILLAYAYAYDFKLYQMDVKSAFLNGFINEEVYVAQPPGFIDFEKPNHVFKLKKALYGLKQAPTA